jgi:DNA-binding MarR family transcriptional regulator
MADVVARLNRKGLIQRRRTKEDARAYAVKLTDEGRRVLRVTVPIAAGVDRSVLGALPRERREPFLTALASVVKRLEPPRRS